MTGNVRAELLILRKRAATWILLGIWTFMGVFAAYVIPYTLDPEDASLGLVELLPESLAGNLISGFRSSAVSSRSSSACSRWAARTAGTR